jgi:hypothetical protein
MLNTPILKIAFYVLIFLTIVSEVILIADAFDVGIKQEQRLKLIVITVFAYVAATFIAYLSHDRKVLRFLYNCCHLIIVFTLISIVIVYLQIVGKVAISNFNSLIIVILSGVVCIFTIKNINDRKLISQ